MKAAKITLLLVAIAILSNAQKNQLDSLKNEIKIMKLKATIDSLKISMQRVEPARSNQIIQPNTESNYAQTPPNADYEARQDELKKEVLNLKSELISTKVNLADFQKQFRVGTIITYGGAALFAIGYLVAANALLARNPSGSLASIPLFIIGGVGLIGGPIVQLDAHRYIGYAGERMKTKSTNTYTK